MEILSEYEYLARVGVPADKMPAPSKKSIHVEGEDGETVRRAITALGNLGYTISPEKPHAFNLVVKTYTGEAMLLSEWMAKVIDSDIESIVKKFGGIGIGKNAARFHIAGRCVKLNNQEANRK